MTTSSSRRPVIALGCAALRQYMIRRLSLSVAGFIDFQWNAPWDNLTGLSVYKSPTELPLSIDSYDFVSFGGEQLCETYLQAYPRLNVITKKVSELYSLGPPSCSSAAMEPLRISIEGNQGGSSAEPIKSFTPSLNQDSGAIICLVIHRLTFGGAEKQLCLLATGLKQLGFEVHLLCFFPSHPKYRSGIDDLVSGGIFLHTINARSLIDESKLDIFENGVSKKLVGIFPGVFQEFVIDGLYHYFSSVKPSAVICYLESSNLLAGIAAVFARVPRVLLSGRNVALDELSKPSTFCGSIELQKETYRVLLSSPRVRLFTNSHEGSLSYARWLSLETPPRVVGNAFGVGASFVYPRRKASKISCNFVIGMMGRLAPEKAPLRFIDVIVHARLYSAYNVLGLYQGDGPLLEVFDYTVHSHGLREYIERRAASEEVESFWSSIDIFILTSDFEGTPNVIMECIQRRMPFVTTCLGSLSEVSSDWLNHMHSSTDPEDICNRVFFLSSHRQDIDWDKFDDFVQSRDSMWLARETLSA